MPHYIIYVELIEMAFKGLYKQYQMFWRLLFTLILLICVPVLIVNWFTIEKVYNDARKQNSEYLLQNAINLRNFFTAQKNAMIQNVVDISVEKTILPEIIERNPIEAIDAIKQLSYYKNNVPISNDCFIYFKGTDYLIGSEYMYGYQWFIDRYSKNEEFADAFDRILTGTDGGITCLPIVEGNNYYFSGMLFFLTTSLKTRNDTVIFYHINGSSLNSSFFGYSEANDYTLSIFDDEGKLLLTNKSDIDGINYTDGVISFISDHSQSTIRTEYQGETFNLFRGYDDELGLSFVLIIPETKIIQTLDLIYQRLMLTTWINIMVLSVMVVIVIMINYLPVWTAIKKLYSDKKMRPMVNEIESIVRKLDETISEKESMQNEIDDKSTHLTEYILNDLLMGKKVSDKDLLGIGIHPGYNRFFAITAFGVPLDIDNQDQIAKTIMKRYDCSVFVTRSVYERYLIFICAFADGRGDIRSCIADTLMELLIESSYGEKFKLCIGSIEASCDKLNSSYINTLISMDQAEYGKAVYYEDTVNQFRVFDDYPTQSVLCFIRYIKQGDKVYANLELDQIMQHIYKSVASVIIKQYVCYDVINMFLKTAMDLGLKLSNENIGKILMSKNIQEIHECMKPLVDRACDEIAFRRQEFERQENSKIVAYLDENYTNPDISLSLVASHFGLPVYSVSKILNELVGVGFSDYIISKRIGLAKQLLLTSDKSISEISLETGYRDVSYFIRLFKKNTNITPNQFRNSR